MHRTGLSLALLLAMTLSLAVGAAGSENTHVEAPLNLTGLEAQAEGASVILEDGTVPLVASISTGSLDVWTKQAPCLDRSEGTCMWGSADTSRRSLDASGGSLTVAPLADESRDPLIGITSETGNVRATAQDATLTLTDEDETWALAMDADAADKMRQMTLPAGTRLLAPDGATLGVEGVQAIVAKDSTVTLTTNETNEEFETGWSWEETDDPGVSYQRTLTLVHVNVNANTAVSNWEAPMHMAPQLPLVVDADQAKLTLQEGTLANATGQGNATLHDAQFTIEDTQMNEDDEGGPIGWFIAVDGAATPPPPTPDSEQVSTSTVLSASGAVLAATALLAYYWPRVSWLSTIGLTPMYSRIKKDELLDHDVRRALFDLVKDDPGIHAHALSEASETGWGTTVYHLRRLERNGFVTSEKKGRYRRFFPASGFLERTREVLSVLQNETTNRIAQLILEEPGLNQTRICDELDVSPSLANWHINRLLDADLVDRERQGRTVHYTPGSAWKDVGDAVELPVKDALLNDAMPA